eukprot:TRINITY_DN23211_c0_g1_i1.p1 TRINITY_DN23211_c0_g1~~TRINITY_DN23211_c0_g1_i1.p1  ORF type:complete len:438 (-),score=118.06 TRINITY_DN23211_c0_g1_i1:583-1896(-)
MAFDLTPKISPFLDRHLVFPLLEFLQEHQIYPEDEILKAKIELLGKTNMVDYAMDIHKSLYHSEDVPQAMVERRAEVVGRLKALEEGAAPLISFLQNPEMVSELRQDKQFNLHMLREKYQIGEDQIEALYHFAKFQFECGNYSGAADYLYQYRTLATNTERQMSALWGKLAAEILMQNWDVAVEELNKLKDIIDSRNSSQLDQLQQRTWLLHWSLFVFYNTENGKNNLVDLFFQEKYLNAIQTNARHLLRYLAHAVVSNKRRRNLLKDLARVIQQENYAFQDPLTEFVECLYVNFDLEGAQQKLRDCEEALEKDFFLGKQVAESSGVKNYTTMPFRDEFLESGRMAVFETYCRIHQVANISTLAEKLDMTPDAAERWIVGLIRNQKLEAKVDAKAGTVVMLQQHPSTYETIIERTTTLVSRTYQLHNNLLAIGTRVA